jgi:SAM-dependent methyltransferase
MKRIYKKLKRITFEDFKKLASDKDLSLAERIGFPNEYREGYEPIILNTILTYLQLDSKRKTVLDIGCGCGRLTRMMINFCKRKGHNLILIDSQEVLSQLPNRQFLKKIYGNFPNGLEEKDFFEKYEGKIDAINVYSVIQHVFLESNIFNFLDKALTLLKPKGRLLCGDVPNISKAKRFFLRYKTKKQIKSEFFKIEHERLDDSIIIAILQRYRNFGFETYLLPQDERLPLSNRREDILIIKP